MHSQKLKTGASFQPYVNNRNDLHQYSTHLHGKMEAERL